MNTQIVDGRSLPSIAVIGSSFNIDSDNLSITIGGTILADIADVFLGLFKGIVKDQI